MARLRVLLPDGRIRTIAAAIVDAAGVSENRKALIESKRRQVQKWRTPLKDGGGRGIGQRNADELAAALKVDAEEFLVPLPTPEELRIQLAEQLEARARELRRPPSANATRL